ncbi:hypothetical protein AB0L34_23670, partial [Micromonospora sp. NPDC052213]
MSPPGVLGPPLAGGVGPVDAPGEEPSLGVGSVLPVGPGDSGSAVWLGGGDCGGTVADGDGLEVDPAGRNGRPRSGFRSCSVGASALGTAAGAVVFGTFTAGASVSPVAPSAAPRPANATSTAAAAPTRGPRR